MTPEEIIVVEKDEGTPAWVQAIFVISFSVNFVCIIGVLCCCFCRRRSQKNQYQMDMLRRY